MVINAFKEKSKMLYAQEQTGRSQQPYEVAGELIPEMWGEVSQVKGGRGPSMKLGTGSGSRGQEEVWVCLRFFQDRTIAFVKFSNQC